MAVKVVDASALGALLFGEPDGEAVAARLRDATLVAPALLGYELASICLKKLRHHPERRDALLGGFGMQSRMPIETVEIDHAAALRLADRSGLTTYDASYLWLAQKLEAELVTLDKRLEAAHLAQR